MKIALSCLIYLVITLDNENTVSSNKNIFFTFSCYKYVNWNMLIITVRQFMIQFNHIKESLF